MNWLGSQSEAAVIWCVVRAAEYQEQSGANSCTSHSCSWLSTTRNALKYRLIEPVDIKDVMSMRAKQPRVKCHVDVPTIKVLWYIKFVEQQASNICLHKLLLFSDNNSASSTIRAVDKKTSTCCRYQVC